MQNKYTTPVIKTGKEVTNVPKGSNKLTEQAKQTWYVEYYYEGKRIRVTENLNRIKDPKEKQYQADLLLQAIKQDLADGLNPLNPDAYIQKIFVENMSLKDAIEHFKEYHEKHQTKKKTVQTYMSKLKALLEYYPNKSLKDFTTKHLENFVQSKIEDGTYSHNSVKAAKRIFSTFFAVMLELEYITVNPIKGFNNKIKSFKEVEEKHVPYTPEDLKTILQWLDQNDKFGAFFCRMVYYTCIRPKEIRGLRIKDINLKNRTITIPANIKKNTINNQSDIINIDPSFFLELEKLNLDKYPKEYFLTGDSKNIIGENKVGENTPYNKLISAFKAIDKQRLKENPNIKDEDLLQNKGYDLYSFKHTSNITKYNAGWTLSQIMKANRHSSIQMTEVYLKKLGSFTDISNLAIPTI